jgi:hypothetical protein
MRSWLAELVRVAPGAVEARVPGLGVDARTREHVSETMAIAAGSRLVAWIHGAWRDFVGRVEPDDSVEALLAFAQASADAGAPVDATVLEAIYEPSVVRATRATVALAGVQVAVARSPAAPLLIPTAAVAGTLRAVARAAPPVPEAELPADGRTNLVMHLLASASPRYLAHAVVRSVLLRNPLVLSIGVRMEGIGATVHIGRGRLRITEGVDDDVVVVIEDGLETLLRVAAGSIVRQVSWVPAH